MVARLKQQVQELKDELAMATGEERTDQLTDEEMAKWVVEVFMSTLHVQGFSQAKRYKAWLVGVALARFWPCTSEYIGHLCLKI